MLYCQLCSAIFGGFPLLSPTYLFLLSPKQLLPYRPSFCSHSSFRSLARSLPPTSVDFKNRDKGPIAFSLASNSASPLFSVQPYHLIPSLHRFLRSFRRAFLHRRNLVYRCSIDCSTWPHHQHWEVLITPILAK